MIWIYLICTLGGRTSRLLRLQNSTRLRAVLTGASSCKKWPASGIIWSWNLPTKCLSKHALTLSRYKPPPLLPTLHLPNHQWLIQSISACSKETRKKEWIVDIWLHTYHLFTCKNKQLGSLTSQIFAGKIGKPFYRFILSIKLFFFSYHSYRSHLSKMGWSWSNRFSMTKRHHRLISQAVAPIPLRTPSF